MSANENKPGGEVILYLTEDLQTRVQVRLESETGWLPEAYKVAGGYRAQISPPKVCTQFAQLSGRFRRLHNFCTNPDCTLFAQEILPSITHKSQVCVAFTKELWCSDG